ncbi:MAG: Unknown protein [uncultured Campylobacterales bacterium]|uniref:ATPase AAA-type core domain-containing protein n=1 Tax=uncultured Campylobacterales bacterium TaxID=352960 RepID=A0A6S6SLW4_9BACT|nr:MAG: Unknown protein [uncultured Campylobacterales bacterium]
MLKRFMLENFLSYRDESYLDLTADSTGDHKNHFSKFGKTKVLKSAVIYGANASGKSNLIKALSYSQDIIVEGLNNVQTYKKYFRLDEKSSTKPTIFEFELEIDTDFYTYGFSILLHSQKIEEEWLYKMKATTSEKIFERKNNDITIGTQLSNSTIKNKFNVYIEDMKHQSNQLFLTEIANKNLENEKIMFLNNIFKWFNNKLIVLYPDSKFTAIRSINKDKNLSNVFSEYLKKFDTGILDINLLKEDFDDSLKHIPQEIKKKIEKDILKDQRQEISIKDSNGSVYTISKNDDNELTVDKLGLIHNKDIDEMFELSDESDGTKRLFDLIPLIECFSKDYTIVIDEFERSLHPNLTRKFFELFYNLNKNKTQLIVTTHEATLLDLKLLRRDEIWFIKKDKKNNSSQTYPLNQFNIRNDKKINKDYLDGRFDAVPIIELYDEIEVEL